MWGGRGRSANLSWRKVPYLYTRTKPRKILSEEPYYMTISAQLGKKITVLHRFGKRGTAAYFLRGSEINGQLRGMVSGKKRENQ